MRVDWGVSIRRACRVLSFDTSTYHYKSRRHGQAGLEARIKSLCETRVRYGYRRVHVLLRREGWVINQKKTRRIYREMGLQLRHKTPKRRVKAKLREDRCTATRPNETWAMDFVHDQLATGNKLRVLTVVDTFSRYAPVVDRGSVTAPKTWSERLSWCAPRPATQRRSAWIRVPSLCRGIWISGPTSAG